MTDDSSPTKPDLALSPTHLTPQQAQEAILTNFVWPVICTAFNGLRLSLRQVPLAHLLVTTCGLAGRFIGETISMGSLTDILQIRGACIKAFTEGVRGVKIKPEPQGTPQHGIDGVKLDS